MRSTMAFGRRGLGAACVVSAAALLALVAPPSHAAGAVATTGAATAITSTSATLNGTIDPQGVDSSWRFLYGTTNQYGSLTPTHVVSGAGGAKQVSETITGLTPGTTYHFTLFVVRGSYPGHFFAGQDATFTTLAARSPGGKPGGKPKVRSGVTSLQSTLFSVHHGRISMPFRCTGVSRSICNGNITLTARGKSGKTVTCASGRFLGSAGHGHLVQSAVSNGCMSLLRNAHGHKIHAALRAVFISLQKQLRKSVTLALG